MKKQTAIIIVSIFLLIVAGLCSYLYYYYSDKSSEKIVEATASFDSGNIDQVIQLLEKQDSESTDERLLLAISYAQKGTVDFDEEKNAIKALEIVNSVLEDDPNNAEAYRIKGYAYEIQKEYTLAVEAYDTSIKLDPTAALTYSSRGHAQDLRGDETVALTDYKTALDLDPTLDHANLNIARVYFRNGNVQLATDHLGRVVEESANSSFKAAAEQILGVIDLSKNNLISANDHFNKAINLDPKLTVAYVGRAEVALAIFFEEFKKNPKLQVEPVFDKVFSDIDTALALNENQTSAYVLAYQILTFAGSKEDAQVMLKKAEGVVGKDITLGELEKETFKKIIIDYKNEK